MMIGTRRLPRRFASVGVVGVLMALLAACNGRGGGYLPPDVAFSGRAQLGFSFSCEDSGGLNPPAGRLRIQLSYADRGSGPVFDDPFSIHGIVDHIDDPVLESMVCSGQNPPPEPDPNTLIFLGRFRPTTSPPEDFPPTCPARETATSLLCRFEVIVRDNDNNLAPSKGDYFAIKLSSATAMTSALDPATVFYTRTGYLAGGNLTVD